MGIWDIPKGKGNAYTVIFNIVLYELLFSSLKINLGIRVGPSNQVNFGGKSGRGIHRNIYMDVSQISIISVWEGNNVN